MNEVHDKVHNAVSNEAHNEVLRAEKGPINIPW